MTNQSIFDAFERIWMHVLAKLGEKAESDHKHTVDEIFEQDDALSLLIKTNTVAPMADVKGNIYTDVNGNILTV